MGQIFLNHDAMQDTRVFDGLTRDFLYFDVSLDIHLMMHIIIHMSMLQYALTADIICNTFLFYNLDAFEGEFDHEVFPSVREFGVKAGGNLGSRSVNEANMSHDKVESCNIVMFR
jgi:hypothetical protein